MPSGTQAAAAHLHPECVLPDNPSHPGHTRYQQVLDGVTRLGHWSPDDARSVTAALYAQVSRDNIMRRIDEVVLGNPSVASPQVFAVYRPHGDKPPIFHCAVPVSTALLTPPSAQLASAQSLLDLDGYLTSPDITRSTVSALEHGTLDGHHAIVLHRTGSSTAASALSAFASGTGTHFLIDKDGTIHQAASLVEKTWHVGKIKSRCYEEEMCSPAERQHFDNLGFAPKAVHDLERRKAYPDRYPLNEDSIGIEVVARHINGRWEDPTPQQAASIDRLVGLLQRQYGLGDRDVYVHDVISYKTLGEGAGLYQPDNRDADPAIVPARGISP